MSVSENLTGIKNNLPETITLVAVSKTKPAELISELYQTGHRVFGENKVQELCEKYEQLPKDIHWHMIGHLQRNKVKYIAPFVELIHGVDSLKLLQEINKRAKQNERTINCLLQVHIAQESSKFGFSEQEVKELLNSSTYQELDHVNVIGLMGMATNTKDTTQVGQEFSQLRILFDQLATKHAFTVLSMGMSGDFQLAIENGSTMIRVGSLIFGERNYL